MHSNFKWLVYVWVLLLSALFGASPSSAQSNEQPNQNYIIGWDAEVMYPQAIRFALTSDEIDLSDVRLTIAQQGTVIEQLSLDLEATTKFINAEEVDLEHIWNIPVDDPLLLFQDVVFEWTLATNTGATASIRDTIWFVDDRLDWSRETPTGNLSVWLPSLEPSFNADGSPTSTLGVTAQAILEDLQPVYDQLSAQLETEPVINLMFYPPEAALGCSRDADFQPFAQGERSRIMIDCEPGIDDALIDASGIERIQMPLREREVNAVVVDRIIDGFFGSLWQGQSVPDWFGEGLAQFLLPTRKSSQLPRILVAVRGDLALTLSGLRRAPDPDADSYDLWQLQSYSLVLYLADQLSVDGLLDFAQAIGDDTQYETFADAYEAVTGRSITTLTSGWERWLLSDAAVSDYNFIYRPGQAATPTPLPPTPTATDTNTPTPTLSPTTTLTPSATFTASPIPTWTDTPAPPTNTPRPPGSLNTRTPTPSPTPASAFSNQPGGLTSAQIILIAVLGVVLIVLIVLYFQLGGRE